MTRFKLMSDLHLEFFDRPRPMVAEQPTWVPPAHPLDKDTVLLLAGDIHVGTKAWPWIKDRCEQYKEVIYILGNHEFYGQKYNKTIDAWREIAENPEYIETFTFLHNDHYTNFDDGFRIFGATLWTEVNDPHMQWAGRQYMTDYNVITNDRGGYRKLMVQDTNVYHRETLIHLEKFLSKPFDGKTIVMTHHLPHELCVHKHFENSPLNDYFRTDLDWVFKKYDIDYWVHGHTHNNVDVHVGKTRILCNPRGYHGIELNRDFDEDLVFV